MVLEPGSKYYCTHCEVSGHSINRCFQIHGFTPNFKGKKIAAMSRSEVASMETGDQQNDTITVEQYNHLMALLNTQNATGNKVEVAGKMAMMQMGMKVYGSDYPITPNVLRVLAAAYEKELEFEYVPLVMNSGAHKQQPFLSLNPFGQVPAVEDGDVKLFESRAITRYMAHKYESKGSQLLIKDAKQMAQVEVWIEVESLQFDPVAIKLGWEIVYKKIFNMEADIVVVEETKVKLSKVLDVYETCLAQSKYLGGETFTLADLHHMPIVHYLIGSQEKQLFEDRPRVSAWCKDILSRPSWQKVVIFLEKLKK